MPVKQTKGTVTLSPKSKIATTVFNREIKYNGRKYTIHSISKSAKEAVRERAILKLRGRKGKTKTFLVFVTYER